MADATQPAAIFRTLAPASCRNVATVSGKKRKNLRASAWVSVVPRARAEGRANRQRNISPAGRSVQVAHPERQGLAVARGADAVGAAELILQVDMHHA